MLLSIEPDGPVPIYQQIRDRIVEAIAVGRQPAGSALPSLRQLAVDLGVNFHTVNKGCDLLRQEGLRHSRSGDPSETVTVAVRTGNGIVRVEVTDRSGPGVPELARVGRDAEGGRGLQLVAGLLRGGDGGSAAG
jgi:DNA-binding transcriptional MocR family regulator